MTVYDHTPENVQNDCSEWPEAARQAWLEAFDPDNDCWQADLVERGFKPWSRPTQYDRGRVYTRYLHFVRDAGRRDEIRSDSVRAWIDHLQGSSRSLHTISAHIRFLCAVARLVYPDHDWAWLARTRDAIAERVKAIDPTKRKDRQIFSTRELWRAGVEKYFAAINTLPTEASWDDLPDWETAQAVRDGVWLLMGAVCPERVGALQQVRVNELDLDAGQLVVPGERTKTRLRSERTFPAEVASALQIYLARVRLPWARAYSERSGLAVHDNLWISKGGKPAQPGTMAAAMKAATTELLGYPVSPHRLRDGAATYIVEEMPEQAALASAILRHRSRATTREYVRQAEQVGAFRLLQEHMEIQRRSLES
jgi:integrase